MSGTAARIAKLETIYVRPRDPDHVPAWVRPIEAMADQVPEVYALWRVGFLVAQRRELAATGQLPRVIADEWADWEARVDAEVEALFALGWDRWVEAARDLPELPGWPSDLDTFYRGERDRAARDAVDARDHLIRLGFRAP